MSITKKGYVRKFYKECGRQRFEHCVVWEKHYGEIPKGMQVHHKDGNKQNNNIDNLILVDTMTHKRLHSGCKIVDGVWWKPCKKCGALKPITDFYKSSENSKWVGSYCKSCFVKMAVIFKRNKRKEWKEQGIKQKY